MSDNIIYIIPAREGSKGLPHKNRELIYYTTLSIHGQWMDTYITTDDSEIIKTYQNTLINIIQRPAELAQDGTSMKDVLMHVKAYLKLSDDTLMVILYPTYPQRRSYDIDDAITFFRKKGAKSLLCRKEYTGLSPYLMMFPLPNNKGGQVIEHNLYRRQDYPEVFEISHFIAIMRADELPKLNLNLYNDDTVFMSVLGVIDVDTQDDFMKWKKYDIHTQPFLAKDI
jgi:N-acylneuraminate cytidylyltransferase